jgi:hypothetical protein
VKNIFRAAVSKKAVVVTLPGTTAGMPVSEGKGSRGSRER